MVACRSISRVRERAFAIMSKEDEVGESESIE